MFPKSEIKNPKSGCGIPKSEIKNPKCGGEVDLNQKIEILKRVYDVYSGFIRKIPTHCKKFCDDCCTGNITGTTLEAYFLLDNLEEEQKKEILDKSANPSDRRFQPKLTFNRLADLCARGKDAEEAAESDSGKCPILSDSRCPVYLYRPFGCRCMVSSKPCSETGYAEIDPLVLSVNDAFMQLIEHLDAGGLSGNFSDVLNFLAVEENRKAYEKNRMPLHHDNLITNIPIRVWMIPPEHREKIESLLKRIC